MIKSTPYLFILALATLFASVSEAAVCNILTYKSAAVQVNGSLDYGPAIWKAYSACIQTNQGDTILVPAGTYSVNYFGTFSGSNWNFQLDGNLNFTFNPTLNTGKNLLIWNRSTNITLFGKGTIIGNGALWRPGGNLATYPNRPRLVRFQNCNNVTMKGLTLLNAPMFHVVLETCNNSLVDGVTIKADNIGETDGFDVSGNQNIVRNVYVENGDECVTVKSPTNGFFAENIVCQYTAGNQIGSFGSSGGVAAVENVHYRNVTMIGSQTAAQIKSWPTTSGYVRNILYEDFTVKSTLYVMSVNLFWCDGKDPAKYCPTATGTLAVSNVTFQNFKGTQSSTSARPVAKAECLSVNGAGSCTDINFVNVSVTSGKGTADSFSNACGTGRSTLPKCN
ncbi:hypothetical protein HDU82_007624 [Entophlyctis luteolus]|nr:hypothetical protein HDU82_007624 [Entophlyctis luteolus]